MNRVVHFELSVEEPEKAVEFYRSVFGWQVANWEGPVAYWLVTTGEPDTPGINGGIMRVGEGISGTVNTLQVDDLDAALQRVRDNGGQVVRDKQPVPGVGYQAYCKDVSGLLFGIHQEDPSAGQ